jgi:hypothetical protein
LRWEDRGWKSIEAQLGWFAHWTVWSNCMFLPHPAQWLQLRNSVQKWKQN